MVDKTGRNVIWVMIAVIATLASHMMLAFTFWNPWIAMVMPLVSLCTVLFAKVLVGSCLVCIFVQPPVPAGSVLLLTGLCTVAHGGLRGT